MTNRLDIIRPVFERQPEDGVDRFRIREIVSLDHVDEEVNRSAPPLVRWDGVESVAIALINFRDSPLAVVLQVIYEDYKRVWTLCQEPASELTDTPGLWWVALVLFLPFWLCGVRR